MLAASSAALKAYLEQAAKYEWHPMELKDAKDFFNSQNQLAQEHVQLTSAYFDATLEEWKTALGFPSDDKRMEFIRNVPSASTRHGDKLHCLKLTCQLKARITTVGFIDFEVQREYSVIQGRNVRDIYMRSISVHPKMRAKGCGKRLFDAMLQYLGVGEIDVIRLSVFDLNAEAIQWYFDLGFRVTGWFRQSMGADSQYSLIFLSMQRIQGDRLLDESGLPIMHVQEMPRLFKEDVVGEVVSVTLDGKTVIRAWIRECDTTMNRFTIVHIPEREIGGQCDGFSHDVDVNYLFSRGYLLFARPATVQLNASASSRSEPVPTKTKKRRKA